MRKPKDYEIKEFFSRSYVVSLSVNYVQISSEGAETRVDCVLNNGDKRQFIGWDFTKFLNMNHDWCSLARLRDQYYLEVDEWKQFERDNELELKEYRRLKEKYGDIK